MEWPEHYIILELCIQYCHWSASSSTIAGYQIRDSSLTIPGPKKDIRRETIINKNEVISVKLVVFKGEKSFNILT